MASDVVELILADHRKFEASLRDLRNVGADRTAALEELSHTLVAPSEAEEREVYPTLRRRNAVDEEQFGEAIEELTNELADHVDEGERTVLNPARGEVDEQKRCELGVAFMKVRQRQIDNAIDCRLREITLTPVPRVAASFSHDDAGTGRSCRAEVAAIGVRQAPSVGPTAFCTTALQP